MIVNSAKDTRSHEEILKTHDNVKFIVIKYIDLFEIINTDEFDNGGYYSY